MQLRADLMVALRKAIDRAGWTQRDAAARLGVTQPRISDLYRSQIGRFRVDALVLMLFRAGVEVHFSTRRAKSA